jgi:hypothetical protein
MARERSRLILVQAEARTEPSRAVEESGGACGYPGANHREEAELDAVVALEALPVVWSATWSVEANS